MFTCRLLETYEEWLGANRAQNSRNDTTAGIRASMWHGRLIDTEPILRNLALRLLERQAPRTNFSVEIILDFILRMRSSIRNGGVERFGPEIFGIGRIAAQFKRNEMVLLVIFQTGIRVA